MARKLSYGMAINEALHQIMEQDDSVFILGEDVAKMGGDFGITKGIWEKWPTRAHDTALSEQAIIGLSAGAAVCGLRPVAEIMFADFLAVCYDQIVNNAAKLNYMYQGEAFCGLTIRAPQGPGISCAYHHSANVEAWFLNTPGLVIVTPTTPYEAKGLLTSAIKSDNPVLFLEHKKLYNVKGEVPEEYYELPLYQAKVKREGNDITVIASQVMVGLANQAADILAKEGISLEIVDPLTVFPYDKETILDSVAKTSRLVVLHEGPKVGGVGAEFSAMVTEDAFEYLSAPVKRVTSIDSPVPFAPCLEDRVMPQLDDFLATCREVANY